MKHITLIAICCLLALQAWAGNVEWKHNYDDAVKEAKSDKKIVMVDIYTDWCGWCKKLDKDVYSNKEVQAKLAKDFVSAKINPEKGAANAKVAQNFGVRGFPYILFVDGDGKKVHSISGYVPAADFLKVLEAVSKKSESK